MRGRQASGQPMEENGAVYQTSRAARQGLHTGFRSDHCPEAQVPGLFLLPDVPGKQVPGLQKPESR